MLPQHLSVHGNPNGCWGQDVSAGGGGSLSSAELEFALDSLCRIRVGGCDLPVLKMKEKNWLKLL